MAVKPVPEGYHTVTPYLIVNDAQGLLDFIQQAFDAKDVNVMRHSDGSVMHADGRIGDSRIMLSQATADFPAMPAMLHLYLDDVDKFYRKALDAGAESVQELKDEYYGDRIAGVKDAFGNQWWLATHVEDVSEEEMARRAAAQQ
jgi:uncharacterized glyoxalase superfamily protein PhnB